MKKLGWVLYLIFTIPTFIFLLGMGFVFAIIWFTSAIVENGLFKFSLVVIKVMALLENRYKWNPTIGFVILYYPMYYTVKVIFYLIWLFYLLFKSIKVGGSWVFNKTHIILIKAYKS